MGRIKAYVLISNLRSSRTTRKTNDNPHCGRAGFMIGSMNNLFSFALSF